MTFTLNRDVLLDFLLKVDEKNKMRFAIINQCAPVIKGLKPATVMMLDSLVMEEELLEITREERLAMDFVWCGGKKSVILIYNKDLLNHILQENKIKEYLYIIGYEDKKVDESLKIIINRMKQYYERKSTFPHEIGIFLGYPLEDVLSYIKFNGKNALYRGYWIVYHNVDEAKRVFLDYDCAREELLHQFVRKLK